jgi:hypothetical protein
MNWLSRIFGRDHDQPQRQAQAEALRKEAADALKESRTLGRSYRAHIRRNHLTEGFAAAFEETRRRRS